MLLEDIMANREIRMYNEEKKGGRPSKYTPEHVAKIVEALEAGAPRKASYEAIGICQSTFLDWMAKHPDFNDKVTRAEADFETEAAKLLKLYYKGQVTERMHTVVTKTVIKMRTTKHPDGTIVEEPVALEDVVTTDRDLIARDWRPLVEVLKRRRPNAWSERVDINKMTPQQIAEMLDEIPIGATIDGVNADKILA